MTKVTFVLLNSEQADVFNSASEQAAHYFRQNKRVFVYTQDQEQAHQIDEILWSFDPNSFVPHNLVGEGPKQGAPVEISWQAPTNYRQVLINLSDSVPEYCHQFQQVIDFVPTEEPAKKLARARYRHYQTLGMVVDTQQAIDKPSEE